MSYGSSGVGTTIHLSGAYLLGRAGIHATHVSFRGAAQTIPAMLSGDVQIAVDNLASYTGVIAEGRMRALAVTSAERWPALPEVPTMAEAGMDAFAVGPWHLWAAPQGTPRPVIDRLSQEIRSAFADPALQAARHRHGREAPRHHAGGSGGPPRARTADLGGDGPHLRRQAGVGRALLW